MTCIVGFVDKKNDCVYIGADSLGSNGYTKSVQSQPKVFRNDTFKDEYKEFAIFSFQGCFHFPISFFER